MSVCLAISTICACHLVIPISEESLFVDDIKLLVGQTAGFHLHISLLDNVTKQLLHLLFS